MMQERELTAEEQAYDARQTVLMRHFWIGFALFLIPFILIVCLVAFFHTRDLAVFWNLFYLLFPAMIFWETRYTWWKGLYQHDLRKLEERLK